MGSLFGTVGSVAMITSVTETCTEVTAEETCAVCRDSVPNVQNSLLAQEVQIEGLVPIGAFHE